MWLDNASAWTHSVDMSETTQMPGTRTTTFATRSGLPVEAVQTTAMRGGLRAFRKAAEDASRWLSPERPVVNVYADCGARLVVVGVVSLDSEG